MFQTHPLDANGKLLRRFYEPLVLLSVLDPTRGAQRPNLITDQGLDELSKLWRNFLDELSWLCDFDIGGDTVTSVAAQQTTENPCFWVASNSKTRHEACSHITWLLNRLTDFYISNSIAAEQAEDELINRCIQFSSLRVKSYTKRLLQAIGKAEVSLTGQISSEDELLFEELHRLEKLAAKPRQLCAMAYCFRRHQSMQILCRRHNAHSTRGVWSDIRHYIGRLGSWTKAVRTLILGTQLFPQRIENAQIKVIEPSVFIDRPNKVHLTNLDGVVRRMLPPDQNILAQELSQALVDASAVTGIEEQFRESYSGFRPRPHAELLVLEHFHHNNFEFVAHDRYIGCSKPSCYCCNIYMQLHIGGFAPRPCHGNLWINWAPPIPLPIIVPNQKPTGRPQDHHTFKMIQNMITRIRRDLQEQILARRPRRSRLPDSTTGISTIAFVHNAAKAIRADYTEDLARPSIRAVAGSSATLTTAIMRANGPNKLLRSHNAENNDHKSERSRMSSPTRSSLRNEERGRHSRKRPQLTKRSDECCRRMNKQIPVDDEDEDILLFKGRGSTLIEE